MCTRIFWNTNDVAKTVSRCMDWAVSDEPDLWFIPRGTPRDGGGNGSPHSWVSTYSSIVVSMWRQGTVDGINERGLGAHALYLDPEPTMFAEVDSRASVANTLWVQYLLDNFATVAEAIAAVDEVRISSKLIRGQEMGVHIALEDASGDSAIIEPIGGRLVVHHGAEYTVMSNSPTMDAQLANRAKYAPFGGELPPPGDISSPDRFVRASYFLHYLPEPKTVSQAVAGVFHLIQNVAVPPGAPYQDGGVYPTWWEAGADLTNGDYYFMSTMSPSLFWVSMAELRDGREVLSLNPRDETLVGDAVSRFAPAELVY
ncbi:linear amide C-N hydrolase [Subtercola sp. PAMC28395]|uniref:linear amide C-N hydrolase n=1 Tax=Subtercola sp. PAMC28395 TaxID=2846775 RepID=UPI001C0AB077|nr:linear amide C-N hydrolase [Subtercola sp. PAMC28395]QWT24783.1 linear amide C-N hydrolase [Subtercola sp. PAMC28395]